MVRNNRWTKARVSTVAAAVSLSCVSCGQTRSDSATTEVNLKHNAVNWVDTHDGYEQSYNPLAPTTPLSSSAVARYSRYFKHESKTISLTFDCAWVEEANGMEILNFLADNKIKATFFISGPFIENRNAVTKRMVKKMIDDGHEFGNHTVSHKHNTNSQWELVELNRRWDGFVKEIYGGQIPENAKMKPYWRAPYGEYGAASLATAASAGFPYHFGWNIDVRDTTALPHCDKTGITGSEYSLSKAMQGEKRCESPRKMTDLILSFIDANRGHFNTSDSSRPRFGNLVVLAHLSNGYRWGSDPRFGLAQLVEGAKARGFSFAPLTSVFAFGSQGSDSETDDPQGAVQLPANPREGVLLTTENTIAKKSTAPSPQLDDASKCDLPSGSRLAFSSLNRAAGHFEVLPRLGASQLTGSHCNRFFETPVFIFEGHARLVTCRVESPDGEANVRSQPRRAADTLVTTLHQGDEVLLTDSVEGYLAVSFEKDGTTYGAAYGAPAFVHQSLLRCSP